MFGNVEVNNKKKKQVCHTKEDCPGSQMTIPVWIKYSQIVYLMRDQYKEYERSLLTQLQKIQCVNLCIAKA